MLCSPLASFGDKSNSLTTLPSLGSILYYISLEKNMVSPDILGLGIGDGGLATYLTGLLVQTQAGRGIT